MKRFLYAALLAVALLFVPSLQAQDHAKFTRTEDVIYGRKFGMALTLDVFEPEKKNGAAIVAIVSGSWFSDRQFINVWPASYQALLDHGYTVFAVVHGSQPRFMIPEIEQDIHRAIRFVRHNAARWGVDSNKFGVTGGSAGGHLSLTIGTQGGPGRADEEDPVDRESSAVQAVACFCPPTDFLNWSKPNEDALELEGARSILAAFGPDGQTREGCLDMGKRISPINFVTSNMPPTLIIHGDADKTVPLYQSRLFEQKCQAVGAAFKLIVKPGADHGWDGQDKDMVVFADWFDQHLVSVKK